MRAYRTLAALVFGLGVLTGCGTPVTHIPIHENGPRPIAGSSSSDLWGTSTLANGHPAFHQRVKDSFRLVTTPYELQVPFITLQAASAGEGAIWVLGVFGEGEFAAGRLHADGRYEPLDVAALQAEAHGLFAPRTQLFARGEVVYVAKDDVLFRRAGDALVAVDGEPAAIEPLGIAGAHYWALERSSDTQAVAHRFDGAQWSAFPVATSPNEQLPLFAASESDLWLGLRHFDGVSFAPSVETKLNRLSARAKPGGTLELVSSDFKDLDAEDRQIVELRAQRVEKTGSSEVRVLDTINAGCSRCAMALPVTLTDGSLVFHFPEAGKWVLVNADDL